jgi:hypothetical protein
MSYNCAYLKEHKDDKLLDHRKIDPVAIFEEIDREYFNGELGQQKTSVKWSKNLLASAFKINVDKNTIALSQGMPY